MTTDIQFIPCHIFGGGWLVPRTMLGSAACADLLGEEAAFLEPIDEDGYIIEPRDVGDIVGALREAGTDVTL